MNWIIGLLPVDSKCGVDAGLFGVEIAGLSNGDDATVFQRQPRADQAMGAQDTADGVPFAVIAGLFELLPDPVEQVVGEYADEDMTINAIFELGIRVL